MRPRVTRAQLIDDLRRVYRETGRYSNWWYLQGYGRHAISTIYRHWDHWKDFVEAAGLLGKPEAPRSAGGWPAKKPKAPEPEPALEPVRLPQRQRKNRRCLLCLKWFVSEGPHNRRCSRCHVIVERFPPALDDVSGVVR